MIRYFNEDKNQHDQANYMANQFRQKMHKSSFDVKEPVTEHRYAIKINKDYTNYQNTS